MRNIPFRSHDGQNFLHHNRIGAVCVIFSAARNLNKPLSGIECDCRAVIGGNVDQAAAQRRIFPVHVRDHLREHFLCDTPPACTGNHADFADLEFIAGERCRNKTFRFALIGALCHEYAGCGVFEFITPLRQRIRRTCEDRLVKGRERRSVGRPGGAQSQRNLNKTLLSKKLVNCNAAALTSSVFVDLMVRRSVSRSAR